MCKRGDTIIMVINGKPRDIDRCIAPIVKALNDGGITTIASCCGHGIRPGNIALEDGRELVICPNFEVARKVDKAFSPLAKISLREKCIQFFHRLMR